MLYCICMSSVAPVFILAREAYTMDWMNSSGGWLTGFLNSFVGIVILNLFYWKLKSLHNWPWDMDEVVKKFVYGDDNIWAIHKCLADHWTIKALSEFIYEYFGMTYTTPNKEAIGDREFMEFEELSFLCRKLCRTQPAKAPLDEESIHGMLLWIKKPKKGISEKRQLAINCEQAAMEYFHYGKEIFEQRVARIREYCEYYQVPYMCKTYEQYHERWTAQFNWI